MLNDYINKKLKEALYKILKDGSYFGEIPSVRGVWANAKTLEECRQELQEVLEDWLVLRLKMDKQVPGLKIEMDRRALVRDYA